MKTLTRLILVLLAAVTALSLSGCGGEEWQAPEERYGVNSCSAVYYDNGSVEFYSFGEDADWRTVYELASNGKTVAAYTALAMVDEGILSLDEKIAPYLGPELLTGDPRLDDITLRQLLCHTAGFSPNYELGTDKKIYSDPGTKFRYSGVGYIYLQSVIENAAGMPFEQAASRWVFEPLGMKNSTFAGARTVTPHMAAGSAALYALLMFAASFAVLILIAFIIGKLTGFKYCSFRSAFMISFFAAGVINAVFLLFFFVSKVFILFLVCFAIMAAALFVTRRHAKLFYACVPVISAALLMIGFALPGNIPVTNDLIEKSPNCAYTFKSTGEDMSIFCGELMEKAKNPDGAFGGMFLPAVEIDSRNAWGLGIAIENDGEDKTYWHSGINPGFQSLFVLCPDQDKYVVILTDSDSGLEYAKEKARSFLGVDGEWEIVRD